MSISRRHMLAGSSALAALSLAGPAEAAGTLSAVYAGSMGVVMDKGIGPAFQANSGTTFHGMGQAALALAHLLAAKTIVADVFVPVSPGPMKIVEQAGLIAAGAGAPVASTEIVLAYSPKSKFASAFAAAKGDDWLKILQSPGLRFGRTDPEADPQGQYVLYTMQLAALYYKQAALAAGITGTQQNSTQIFAEPSLLSRLQEGQIDATLGYKSAILSQKLPFIALPAEINFGDPALAKTWYAKAALTLTVKGVTKTVHPGLLVFYAAVLKNAPNPQAAQAFLAFLTGADGQAVFAKYGYGPAKGAAI